MDNEAPRSFSVRRHDGDRSIRVQVAPDASPTAVLAAYWQKVQQQQQQPMPRLILEELDPGLQGGEDWVECSPHKPVPDCRRLRAVLEDPVKGMGSRSVTCGTRSVTGQPARTVGGWPKLNVGIVVLVFDCPCCCCCCCCACREPGQPEHSGADWAAAPAAAGSGSH